MLWSRLMFQEPGNKVALIVGSLVYTRLLVFCSTSSICEKKPAVVA